MPDKKTINILISVVGKGRVLKDGQHIGYEQTEYVFNPEEESKRYVASKTAFFGIALYEYLKNSEGLSIDKFIVIGTDKSAWSELYQILPQDARESEKITEMWMSIYEAEKRGISVDEIKSWQEALNEYLPILRFYKIEPLDFEKGIDIILGELEEDTEDSQKDISCNIIFDMTHSFRSIPIVFSYGIMLLKYLRKIESVRIFYGAHEMKEYFSFLQSNQSPAIEIKSINRIVRLIESMATFKNSGYFVPLLLEFGLGNRENLYFKLEMNRQPRSELNSILEDLEGKRGSFDYDYEKDIINILQSDFSEINNQNKLYLRMFKRALFFYDKKQYLKALILLYEAFLVLFADVYKIKDNMNYDSREEARQRLKNEIRNAKDNPQSNRLILNFDEAETIRELEYVRNAAAHGSSPRSNQNYLESIEDFRTLFNSAKKLFEQMIQRK